MSGSLAVECWSSFQLGIYVTVRVAVLVLSVVFFSACFCAVGRIVAVEFQLCAEETF